MTGKLKAYMSSWYPLASVDTTEEKDKQIASAFSEALGSMSRIFPIEAREYEDWRLPQKIRVEVVRDNLYMQVRLHLEDEDG